MPLELKLYWCEIDDHHEDWFIVACDAEAAADFHRLQEGYDDDTEVATTLVMTLPESLQIPENAGWPSHELLEACGARFLRTDTPRVVELRGVRWVEGMLEHQVRKVSDDAFERTGRGRPNGTDPETVC